MISVVRSAGQDRKITLAADEADRLLDVLDAVVVSLDRIGSRLGAGEDPGHTWIHEYFTTGGATDQLSRARGILLDAFYRVYTEDELEVRWDERQVAYWSPPPPEAAPKPDER